MAAPPDYTTPSTSSRSRKKKTRHNENDKPYPSSSSNLLPSSKSDLCQLIAVLTVATLVLVICNFLTSNTSIYQKQKHQPPFCDTSSTSTDHELYDDYYYCRPCPEYGVCYDGKLECQPGYIQHDADDSKVCVEDGHVHQVAKMLSEWVQVRVCEAYSQLLCTGIGKSWVPEGELWNDLYEYRKDSYGGDPDEAIYMLAKQRAMETIRNSLETRRENHGVEEFKCTESLVNQYKPLTCSVRQWIIKHILLLVMACPLLVGCILISFRACKQHQLSVRAEQLYHEVCDILEEKPLSSRTSDGEYESWVVASWLRDHILTPKERKDPSLWKKVEELVQEDSRVEQYPKLVKGESKVVWEWQVEGSLSSGKKKNHVRSPKSEGCTNSIARSIYAA